MGDGCARFFFLVIQSSSPPPFEPPSTPSRPSAAPSRRARARRGRKGSPSRLAIQIEEEKRTRDGPSLFPLPAPRCAPQPSKDCSVRVPCRCAVQSHTSRFYRGLEVSCTPGRGAHLLNSEAVTATCNNRVALASLVSLLKLVPVRPSGGIDILDKVGTGSEGRVPEGWAVVLAELGGYCRRY